MDKYTTLYEIGASISNGSSSTLVLSNDDVVSLSIINDYDYATFPIIRIRLYIDIDKYTYINDDPNNLTVLIECNPSVNKINQTDSGATYTKVYCSGSVAFGMNGTLNGYVETKNNAYTKYDNYQMGTERDSSLNTNNKVPITIYCYDAELVRAFKQKVPGIYKNTSLQYIVNDMVNKCGITKNNIMLFDNSEKFDQVLIPNLSLMEAISYLDTYYGLYEHGTQMYCDNFNGLFLGPATPTNSNGTTMNIRVASYKAGDSFSGVIWTDANTSSYQTPDTSVVIKSQTDLEQATNSQIFGSMNVATYESVETYLEETFKNSDLTNITTPDIIHKSKNKFIPSMYKARVNERNTRIDLSLNGYVLMNGFDSRTGFSFTFDNPIRGIDIGRVYRPMNATHVLTNIGSGVFDIQSTFQLC